MESLISIISDGTKTLSKLCEQYGANIQIVLQLNDDKKSDLMNWNKTGQKVPEGVVLTIPDTLSEHYDIGKIYSTNYKSGDNPESLLLGRTTTNSSPGGNTISSNGLKNVGISHKTSLSSFIIYHKGSVTASYSIPAYPTDVSDSNSPSFSAVSLLGRSVDYQIYNGSSRTLSFNLTLHEEMFNNYSDLHKVVAALDSACYPNYSGENVLPPEILFIIGGGGGDSSGFKKIRGILESFSPTWKPPIIDGRLVVCEMSLSIKETTGPYSGSEVKSMKGIRGY